MKGTGLLNKHHIFFYSHSAGSAVEISTRKVFHNWGRQIHDRPRRQRRRGTQRFQNGTDWRLRVSWSARLSFRFGLIAQIFNDFIATGTEAIQEVTKMVDGKKVTAFTKEETDEIIVAQVRPSAPPPETWLSF